jgi:hypothetical protein
MITKRVDLHEVQMYEQENPNFDENKEQCKKYRAHKYKYIKD